MAGPSIPWVDYTLEELITGAMSAALFTKLRNNQEHLYEIAHAGGYGGGAAHTHASSGATAVDLTAHENLLIVSCPGKRYAHKLTGSDRAWFLDGFAPDTDPKDNTGTLLGGDAINERMYQIVGGEDAGESIGMFGKTTADGMDCVASFFIKTIDDNATAGALSFGFADNSTTTFTDSAPLVYTDISSTWSRVYARFTQAGAAHSTDVRFLINVTTGFSSGIKITGLQLNRGRHLAPWTISNVEGDTAKQGNVNYSDMPDCPLIDQRIAMDDAVDLTP